MFRPVVRGVDRIPAQGPVLLAPVHRSNLDFAFTVFVSKRKVFFMAKDSLFKFRPFGLLLRSLGAFPVNRGAADREAMAAAESVLQQGQALVLFPEGTRQSGRTINTLLDGTAFIASRHHASVVPIGISHTDSAWPSGQRFPKPQKVGVVVGRPITIEATGNRAKRSEIKAKTEELQSELQAAYDESFEILNAL